MLLFCYSFCIYSVILFWGFFAEHIDNSSFAKLARGLKNGANQWKGRGRQAPGLRVWPDGLSFYFVFIIISAFTHRNKRDLHLLRDMGMFSWCSVFSSGSLSPKLPCQNNPATAKTSRLSSCERKHSGNNGDEGENKEHQGVTRAPIMGAWSFPARRWRDVSTSRGGFLSKPLVFLDGRTRGHECLCGLRGTNTFPLLEGGAVLPSRPQPENTPIDLFLCHFNTATVFWSEARAARRRQECTLELFAQLFFLDAAPALFHRVNSRDRSAIKPPASSADACLKSGKGSR